jgi:hypothetical protein
MNRIEDLYTIVGGAVQRIRPKNIQLCHNLWLPLMVSRLLNWRRHHESHYHTDDRRRDHLGCSESLCSSGDPREFPVGHYFSVNTHISNYFRLARRPKIGHDSVSGLQRRFSQSLDELPH